jgi:hypothetical protein
MRTSAIAAAILKDNLAERPETVVDVTKCHMCGYTFTPVRGFGINKRFCSRLCVDAYDAGYSCHAGGLYKHRAAGARSGDGGVAVPAYDRNGNLKNPRGSRPYARNLPAGGGGFLIECRQCKRQFASKGLRCCSPECERQLLDAKKTKAELAKVEME